MEELMRKTVLLRPPIDTHYFLVRENPFHYIWRNAMSPVETNIVSQPEAFTASPQVTSNEDRSITESQSFDETSESSGSASQTEQSSIGENAHTNEHTPKYSLRDKRNIITRENIINFPAYLDEQRQFRPKRAKIDNQMEKQQKQRQLDLLKKQLQIRHQQEMLKKEQNRLELLKEEQHKTKATFHKPTGHVPKWTNKETTLLVVGVSKHGKDWTKIHTVYNFSASRTLQSMIQKYASLVRNGEHTKLLKGFYERTKRKYVSPKETCSLTQPKLVTKKISISPPVLQKELPIVTPIQSLIFDDLSSFEQSPEFGTRRKSNRVQKANRVSKDFYNDKEDPYFIHN